MVSWFLQLLLLLLYPVKLTETLLSAATSEDLEIPVGRGILFEAQFKPTISCHSKNLIYFIECKKCHLQYIVETKRQLNERFGEHRRYILNHEHLSTPTPVSLHFNQADHSINDVHLIPIELIRSKRDPVRKAREAHLINKAKTLHPFGINRKDEARQ